jgi:cytochrome oxidase Cu insertion factor (SCO1/SenC/PrrC family)
MTLDLLRSFRFFAVCNNLCCSNIGEKTMLKKVLCLGLLIASSVWLLAQQPPQQTRPPAPKTHLKVGDAAPDFTLPATDGKTYTLSEFRGKKNVVLAFYVLAFTGG